MYRIHSQAICYFVVLLLVEKVNFIQQDIMLCKKCDSVLPNENLARG